MGVIYIDQNYVSDVAGHTRRADAEVERQIAFDIARSGERRFAVSVWNMYETARANYEETREGCLEYIDHVQPLICTNPRLVQFQELVSLLSDKLESVPYRHEEPRPFCETPGCMWATYRSTPFVGETFRDGVEMLRQKPPMADLERALDGGPEAALVVRNAFQNGRTDRDAQVIDREWLLGLFPERNANGAWVDKRQRIAMVEFLLENMGNVYRRCPSVHAEEQIFRYRISGNRKLKRSDGPDVQFVVLAVAYCDFIITSDGPLGDMFKCVVNKIGSECRLLSKLGEL